MIDYKTSIKTYEALVNLLMQSFQMEPATG